MPMSRLVLTIRKVLAAAIFAFGTAGTPALGDDSRTATLAWQEVISLQIEAFRNRDASTAFRFAGEGFQLSYSSAEAFFLAIVTSGYAPIMDSVSHSFGPFREQGEAGIVQDVLIVASDRVIYNATYQLAEEAEGWRVQGVQLRRTEGISI